MEQPGLQSKAARSTRALRDFDEEHAERIDIALELAHGAATDIAMLRTDIDDERAQAMQAIGHVREALKESLRGGIKCHRGPDGRYMALFHLREPTPGMVAIVREICLEMNLDAEHAG